MRLSTLIVTTAIAAAMAVPALAQPPGGGGRGPQMTPEQRAEAFKTADANKDNKLSKEEYATTLPEQFRANAEASFTRRDANTDGSISLEEFTAPGRGGGRGGPGGGGRPGGGQ